MINMKLNVHIVLNVWSIVVSATSYDDHLCSDRCREPSHCSRFHILKNFFVLSKVGSFFTISYKSVTRVVRTRVVAFKLNLYGN